MAKLPAALAIHLGAVLPFALFARLRLFRWRASFECGCHLRITSVKLSQRLGFVSLQMPQHHSKGYLDHS